MELSNSVEQALEVRWSQGVGFYTTDGSSVAGQIILDLS